MLVGRSTIAIVRACACVALCVLGQADYSFAEDTATEFFEKQIRPILVDRCEACHSASKGKTNGSLALDSRDGWLKGGESGPAIVPGKPSESLLISAVQYDADGLQMPPKEGGGKLSDREIEALSEWVQMGAIDPRVEAPRSKAMTPEEAKNWWSFRTLRHVNAPAIADPQRAQSDIDSFVLAELDRQQLPQATPAERHQLLRRVTFDLTGLPPSLEDIEEFISDPSDDAVDRVVDRLLASPTYGQRWTRHWLDVVRYADFHDANPKTRVASCEITEAWRYRDWVVDALNQDLPFDQFIQHQIAGDMIPSPPGEDVYPAGLIATTFLSNGVWDRGDADKEKIVSDMADDNIDTVGKAFLGLTLGCARCHDHKFDPVSTEDYYGLAGIFYSSHNLQELGVKGGEYTVNRVPLVSPKVLEVRKQQQAELAATKAKLSSLDMQQEYADLTDGGVTLIPTKISSSAGAAGSIADDGVITMSGAQAKDTYQISAVAPDEVSVRFLRLEALSNPQLPRGGPGRAGDGNFVINRATLSFRSEDDDAETNVTFSSAKADFEQNGFKVGGVIDDNPDSGWAIDPVPGMNHVAVLEIPSDVAIPAQARLTISIVQTHSDAHTLGRFRLTVTDQIRAAAPMNIEQRAELTQQRDQLQAALAVALPLAMATTEGGTPGGLFPNVQDVPIHIRGSYSKLGKVVPRRFPRFLAGIEQSPITDGSGRRELARWVSSAENPLTARVIANRIWQWHFGEGLVRTSSNFGKTGEHPSHPELLDWLATRLIDDGWSLKKLHRRILLTSTYQQSSQVSREWTQQDPENVWLSRFAARRLDAEAIRDALLSAAGRLDLTLTGPAGDDFTIRRRSLYVQTARWDRSNYAMLFDAANPDASTEKRIISTVAPQALLMLNHEFIGAQSEQLANRLLGDSVPDEPSRIQRAYLWLFGRPASPDELAIGMDIVTDPNADRVKAWIDYAHVLLCTNEFVYLD